MKTILSEIKERLAAAVATFEGTEDVIPQVSPAADTKFGDYQSNAAMVLSKQQKKNPRELAAAIIGKIDVADLCHTPEIAGPGFINFKVKTTVYAQRLAAIIGDDRLGTPLVDEKQTILIDYSSPNVAKPMHIGHIRSTVIGDCLARIARFIGHDVIADNHIGDWGTPIGQILYGWKNHLNESAFAANPVAELLRLYQLVKATVETDKAVEAACLEETVKLQARDPENIALWEKFIAVTSANSAKTYQRLDIHFDTTLGESFYDDRLAPVVDLLLSSGIAKESDGAIGVFSNGDLEPKSDPLLVHRDGEWEPVPCLIRKKDGGFNYATTDIATIDYRVNDLKADKVLYVVDDRQTLHFRHILEVARQRGIQAALVHVGFGKILGPDRKPYKTRSGEVPSLDSVLDEAVQRARTAVDEKNADLPEEERAEIAEIIGLRAVKYAELSQSRVSDYVFDWDKMLALSGNTSPYLQFAYVRARSIFRKLGQDYQPADDLELTEPAERALASKLCQYGETLPDVLNDYRPNILANYLYELATVYHSFVTECHVLRSEGIVRQTRLALCEATARVLSQGLQLMGIRVTEKM